MNEKEIKEKLRNGKKENQKASKKGIIEKLKPVALGFLIALFTLLIPSSTKWYWLVIICYQIVSIFILSRIVDIVKIIKLKKDYKNMKCEIPSYLDWNVIGMSSSVFSAIICFFLGHIVVGIVSLIACFVLFVCVEYKWSFLEKFSSMDYQLARYTNEEYSAIMIEKKKVNRLAIIIAIISGIIMGMVSYKADYSVIGRPLAVIILCFIVVPISFKIVKRIATKSEEAINTAFGTKIGQYRKKIEVGYNPDAYNINILRNFAYVSYTTVNMIILLISLCFFSNFDIMYIMYVSALVIILDCRSFDLSTGDVSIAKYVPREYIHIKDEKGNTKQFEVDRFKF